jgi:hypothetical protein
MLKVLVDISLKVLLQKRYMGVCKSIHKKSWEKNGQVSKISKTMGTQMPAWKKEMNKIVPILLQKYFQVSKES